MSNEKIKKNKKQNQSRDGSNRKSVNNKTKAGKKCSPKVEQSKEVAVRINHDVLRDKDRLEKEYLRNEDNGNGVSIIMRYTLRLLTFQQFERASAMICACELLRLKYKIPGREISIGLWVGKALTPNSIDMADKILKGYSDPDNESSNPRQIEKCPWCGHEVEYSCDTIVSRMHIKCTNKSCDFHKGLPIYLIDEEIYKFRPKSRRKRVVRLSTIMIPFVAYAIKPKVGILS